MSIDITGYIVELMFSVWAPWEDTLRCRQQGEASAFKNKIKAFRWRFLLKALSKP